MAKTDVTQWDTVAANNTDLNSIPIDGAVTTPSQVDNLFREMMAQIKSGISASYFLPSGPVLTLPQINDTSSTHQYVFGVNELAADRTVTLPLLTADDTFVFAAFTQTLTNKTLTSPTITTPTLTLKQSAAPVPTAEGDIQWDTDDNVLAIGDGAATQLFVPIPASTAAGDLEYFTAAKVKARLAKGTADQVLTMNAGATAPEWGTPVISKSFTSSQQTITLAGALTLAHGLGAAPDILRLYLVCVTAEQGYAVGDFVEFPPGFVSGNRGISLVPDGTNLNIRYGGAAPGVINKSTGLDAAITTGNWRLVVRAWA